MSQNQAVYFMNKWQLIKNLDECNLEEQEIFGGESSWSISLVSDKQVSDMKGRVCTKRTDLIGGRTMGFTGWILRNFAINHPAGRCGTRECFQAILPFVTCSRMVDWSETYATENTVSKSPFV